MSWIWHLLGKDWFVLLGAITGLGLGSLPVIHHLVFGLHEKRREILDYFQPHSILLYFKQFLISLPLAYAISALLTDAAASPVAFALGAFPTDTLTLILRRQAAQRLGLGEDTGTQKLELEALQGVNKTLAEKFGEIGIMTTLQLAYEDPIQLTMRTNLSFNYITDVVSQALAIIYGLDLTITRPYSVRGAFEASEVFEDYGQAADPEAKARADAVITQLAIKLERPERIIQKILHDIHGDPYTQFLRAIWVDDDEQVGSSNAANGFITSAESDVENPQR